VVEKGASQKGNGVEIPRKSSRSEWEKKDDFSSKMKPGTPKASGKRKKTLSMGEIKERQIRKEKQHLEDERSEKRDMEDLSSKTLKWVL